MDQETIRGHVSSLRQYVTGNLPLSTMSDDELFDAIEHLALSRLTDIYLTVEEKVDIVQQVYSSIRGFGILDAS